MHLGGHRMWWGKETALREHIQVLSLSPGTWVIGAFARTGPQVSRGSDGF